MRGLLASSLRNISNLPFRKLKYLFQKGVILSTEHEIDWDCSDVLEIFYIHKIDHRNKSPQKSQWTISLEEERTCFSEGMNLMFANCQPEALCWGLHLKDGKVEYLGEAAAYSRNPYLDLFIAKFVDGNRNNKWHGYPANPASNQQDIPPRDILKLWMSKGYLKASMIRRIARGKKCKL